MSTSVLDPKPMNVVVPEGRGVKGPTRFKVNDEYAYSNARYRFEPREGYEQNRDAYPAYGGLIAGRVDE